MMKRVGCLMPGQVERPERTASLVQHLLEAGLAGGEHVEAARIHHPVERDAARRLRGEDLEAWAEVRDLRGGLRGARVVLGPVGEEEDDVVALPVGAGRVLDAVHGRRGRAVAVGTV